jgi:hypothetical protein
MESLTNALESLNRKNEQLAIDKTKVQQEADRILKIADQMMN